MQYLLRFLLRGPISPRVHGTLDYLLAAALIAVPLVVDFHDDTLRARSDAGRAHAPQQPAV